MDKRRLSEWLLAQQYGEKRASEIVGDLYEQYGSSWLALRILITALVMNWRLIAAVILTAIFVVSPELWKWDGWVVPTIQTLHLFGSDQGAYIWLPVLAITSTMSWSVAVLCGVRYGLSDLMTRVSLGFAIMLSINTLFAFKPHRRLAIACFIVTGGLLLLARRRTARAMFSLVAIAGLEYGVLMVTSAAFRPFLDIWAVHHRFLQMAVFNQKFETLVYGSQFVQWILCAAVAAWMLRAVRMRVGLIVEGSE